MNIYSIKFIRVKIILVLLLVSMTTLSYAKEYENVIYLKNGSIIRGTIIEQIPDVSVKIETADGNFFVYNLAEVKKITKEKLKETAPLGSSAFSFNPLGFAQFGPSMHFEIEISPMVYLVPHLRYSKFGLVYNMVVEYDEIDFSSMAIGVGVKRLFKNPGSINSYYIGSAFEYGWGSGSNDPSYYYEDGESFEHSYYTIMSNFGYRWRYESKFFINLGLYAGMTGTITDEKVYPNSIEYDIGMMVFGMLELSFGWEF